MRDSVIMIITTMNKFIKQINKNKNDEDKKNDKYE